jgi:tRNA-Thr(GGU) m(6)t(6)A37 methyltransferase TsaA
MEETTLRAIGVIHTAWAAAAGTPIQSSRSDAPGEVEVFSEYAEGLDGIEGFSNLYLIYGFHQAAPGFDLHVTPFLDDQPHGLFATRFPRRPNRLGISVVELVRRDGNRLIFRGADMLDGTPLWDVKPYVVDFDVFPATRFGWYERRAHP